MPGLLHYVDLSLPELNSLDRDKTVMIMPVSPIEVHGPHLPTGTDIFVAEELQRRYVAELQRLHPELTIVTLPALHVGSDALPVAGSLSVPAVGLRTVLLAYVRGLSRQGFRYLFLADNHGGPRHQMAIESASQKAWKNYGFSLVNPFSVEFRAMCQHDAKFLCETGLGPGSCGDDADAHAGTNETSLMMVSSPEKVHAYSEVPDSIPPRAKLRVLAALASGMGARKAGADLRHLGNTLGWVSQRNMLPYMGAPARASVAAGEAMLAARVKVAMGLFEKALRGERVDTQPMLWWLRFMMRLPE